jgi:NAD(P)H dehydrogenase (quinone)
MVYLSRDDVAAAAVAVLLDEAHAGTIYNGTGPAMVSGPDKAPIASDIRGKPVSYAGISEDQLRGGLSQAGLPPFVIDAVAEIKRTFVQSYFDLLTSDIERLSGRTPQSSRDVLSATPWKGVPGERGIGVTHGTHSLGFLVNQLLYQCVDLIELRLNLAHPRQLET